MAVSRLFAVCLLLTLIQLFANVHSFDLCVHEESENALCNTILIISDDRYPSTHHNLEFWINATPECTKIVIQPIVPTFQFKQITDQAAANHKRITIAPPTSFTGPNYIRNRTLNYVTEETKYVIFIDGALRPNNQQTITALLSGLLNHPDIPIATGLIIEGASFPAKTGAVFNHAVGVQSADYVTIHTDINNDLSSKEVPLEYENNLDNVHELITTSSDPIFSPIDTMNSHLFAVRAQDIRDGLFWFDQDIIDFDSIDFCAWVNIQLRNNEKFSHYKKQLLFEPHSISTLFIGENIKSVDIPFTLWRGSELTLQQSMKNIEAKWGIQIPSTHLEWEKQVLHCHLSAGNQCSKLGQHFYVDYTHKLYSKRKENVKMFAELYISSPLELNRLIYSFALLTDSEGVQFRYGYEKNNKLAHSSNIFNITSGWNRLTKFFSLEDPFYTSDPKSSNQLVPRATGGKKITGFGIIFVPRTPPFTPSRDYSDSPFVELRQSVKNGEYVKIIQGKSEEVEKVKNDDIENRTNVYSWYYCDANGRETGDQDFVLTSQSSLVYITAASKLRYFFTKPDFIEGSMEKNFSWEDWKASNSLANHCSETDIIPLVSSIGHSSLKLISWSHSSVTSLGPAPILKQKTEL